MAVILFAIPLFFLLIAIEWRVDVMRKTGHYRLNDAITSLNIGVLSRVTTVLHHLIPVTFYALVFEHFALITLPSSPLIWVAAFVIYDFFYYWKHRMGHEMSILWAAHVVHHSSEDYNLTTALRQTSGAMLTWIFFLPLAVLGVKPEWFVTIAALNLVYQFWVHTQHIDRLGWMEKVFVTPSNHRVHHAQNRAYIDKNYGGVFIIWDRLFGTFEDEDPNNKPVFGIRGALKSFNPLMANWQVYSQLLKDSYYTRSWRDKFKVWFGRTGWRPDDVSERFPIVKRPLEEFVRFNPVVSPWLSAYSVFQHVFVLAVTLYLLINLTQFPLAGQLILCGVITLTSVQIGCILQGSSLALKMEFPRLVLIPIAAVSGGFHAIVVNAAILTSVFSVVMLLTALRVGKSQHVANQPLDQGDASV